MVKHYIYFLLFIILISCEPDEGKIDEEPVRVEDLTGSWLCNEKSTLEGNSTFTVQISKDTLHDNSLLMSNFYHAGNDEQVRGTLASNVINIPSQQFCDQAFTIYGNGNVISTARIEFVYYVNTGADLDTLSAVLSR